MAAGQGFKTFATGDVLTAADTNGYLMQGVWVFADATARDAAVTSPQEGNVCYLKSTDAVMTYSGSAWVAVGGSTATWTTWSPTLNGVTVGNGTTTARYNTNNNVVYFTCKFLLGTTSSISGASVNITLPVTAASTEVGKQIECMIRDEGTAYYIGSGLILSTTQAQVRVSKSDATYTSNSDISSTVPMTWTSTDFFIISGFYEKA